MSTARVWTLLSAWSRCAYWGYAAILGFWWDHRPLWHSFHVMALSDEQEVGRHHPHRAGFAWHCADASGEWELTVGGRRLEDFESGASQVVYVLSTTISLWQYSSDGKGHHPCFFLNLTNQLLEGCDGSILGWLSISWERARSRWQGEWCCALCGHLFLYDFHWPRASFNTYLATCTFIACSCR